MFRLSHGQLLFRSRPGAVSVGFHWSLLLGLAVFSRFTFAPWFIVGFLALVLVHEWGHAALVRYYRLNVEAIVFHALGGECRFSGAVTQRKRQVIAWGGVVAQAALLIVALLVGQIAPPEASSSAAWATLYSTFTVTNLWMIGLNLLPLPGFDGHYAWRVFRTSSTSPKKRRPPPQRVPHPDGDNVISFPGGRARAPASDGEAAAFGDVNAEIIAIAARVNAQAKPPAEDAHKATEADKRRDSGEQPPSTTDGDA